MYKALLIPFDDKKPVEIVEINDRDDIYKHVAPDSRMFTVVGGHRFDLLGDDEGLYQGNPAERINARAMEIYAADQRVGLSAYASPLVGDFLAVGPVDDYGNQTDVPGEVIKFRFTWESNLG